MSLPNSKEWMKEKDRRSPIYSEGVLDFLNFVKENGGGHELFPCPCKVCRNGKGNRDLKTIQFHLLQHGINQSYTSRIFHGEKEMIEHKQFSSPKHVEDSDDSEVFGMEKLVDDAYGVHQGASSDVRIDNDAGGTSEVPIDSQIPMDCSYKSLKEKAKEPLYPSCPNNVSTLCAVVELHNLKSQFGWSRNSMTELLKLFKRLLPKGNTLPEKYPEMKKLIKGLGMNHKSYHACYNHYILYWKEHAHREKCPVCGTPRYKASINNGKKLKATKEPMLMLRHFSIISRLKRLYSVPWIVHEMTGHRRAKSLLDIMHHQIDSSSWSMVNRKLPQFAEEEYSVRLGLTLDGFNPFVIQSNTFICWPMIIVPYNLPPSTCMKREFSMLSLLILERRAPRQDIDVFLQPLIDELKQLWNVGVSVFNSYTKRDVTLKAMLLWLIHDFPAYGNLSGCTTHGYFACPICAEEIESINLQHSKKICYLGCRRFLPTNHKLREDKHNFKHVEHGKV